MFTAWAVVLGRFILQRLLGERSSVGLEGAIDYSGIEDTVMKC
jgi:hypothetical protein